MFDFLKKIFKKNSNKRVIRFGKAHAIGLDCYNASDLTIAYGRFGMRLYSRESNNDKKREIAGPKPEGFESRADMGLFEVFRDVVKLSWHDYDDNEIKYEFRFEDIFKDKIIPHLKEDEDLIYWDDPISGTPGIIIEVDNRTLSIYSDMTVRFKIPNSNRLKHRRDRILVFSKTF